MQRALLVFSFHSVARCLLCHTQKRENMVWNWSVGSQPSRCALGLLLCDLGMGERTVLNPSF